MLPEAVECRPRDPPGEDVRAQADPARVPGHHADDVDTPAPVHEPGVVAGIGDPPGLVQHRGGPRQKAVELPVVGDVREDPEEVARVPTAEAPVDLRERAEPASSLVDRAVQPREIPGCRVLADSEGGLLVHPDRYRAAAGGQDLVAPVHEGVADPQGAHQRVHPARAAARRAAQPDEEPVRRGVVGVHEHAPELLVEPRAGGRLPANPSQHLHRDRQLQGRRRREAGAGIPGGAPAGAEVLDEGGRDPRVRARDPPDASPQSGIQGPPREARRTSCAREAVHGADPLGGAPAPGIHGDDADANVAGREVQREPEASRPADVSSSREVAVHVDANLSGSGEDAPGDSPEGHLSWRRRDERGSAQRRLRRKGGRGIVDVEGDGDHVTRMIGAPAVCQPRCPGGKPPG